MQRATASCALVFRSQGAYVCGSGSSCRVAALFVLPAAGPSERQANLDIWQVLILAVVQGIAEFLPISSSGHLVIVAALLGKGSAEGLDVADVNIVLHLGTLVSIVVFYWGEILRLLTKDRRVIPLLIVGTIPAVVLGLWVKSQFEHLLSSPALAGWMLLLTGLLLILTRRLATSERQYHQLGYWDAVKIGVAQSFALLPGISRSGTTIAAGLFCGLRREDAAAFSFLLAIPAIGGAALLEIIDLTTGSRVKHVRDDLGGRCRRFMWRGVVGPEVVVAHTSTWPTGLLRLLVFVGGHDRIDLEVAVVINHWPQTVPTLMPRWP